MSVAPTVARARPRKTMSETGDPAPEGTAVRVEDIERALVLAREVAAATARGGSANLRMEHLQALFGNGHGPVPTERMQAALQAAGLSAEPPLTESPDTVQLRVERRRAALSPKPGAGGAKRAAPPSAEPVADEPPPRLSGVAAYQAMAGRARRPKPKPERAPAAAAVSLGDAERVVIAEHAEQNTAQSIAALMPATILPVLAASFLGPLFGAAFAGLALLTWALLSRPGALADGRLGPIRMPASLARSFLLLSAGVALGALATSLALVAAGGGDTERSDPNAPLEQKQTTPSTTTQPRTTTPPAPPASQTQQQEEDAAAERRAERRRAERRREARARARERAREREATPPSGGAPDTGTTTTP
jgi:hypothetical protein